MKAIRIVIIIGIITLAVVTSYWAIFPYKSPVWTGFGTYSEKEGSHRAKTLWDWLDLLIIPVVIGIVAWTYEESEKEKSERNAQEKAFDNILESFLNVMTTLLLEKGLGSSTQTDQTLSVARTRVILALNNLDGVRKGQVVQFLYESKLIHINPTLDVVGVDLKKVVLSGIFLSGCEIRGAYFNGASMKNTNLSNSCFVASNFMGADLSGSLLDNSDLSFTNLSNANLENIDLTTVELKGANLSGTNLNNCKIKKSQLDDLTEKENLKTENLQIYE